MDSNREFLLQKFTAELNRKIGKKFGKISSSKFADQFNLRAYGTSTITRETARKWLNGKCIPDLDKFPVLIEWLDIDIRKIIDVKSQKTGIVSISNNLVDLDEPTYLFSQYDNETKRIALFLTNIIYKMGNKEHVQSSSLSFSSADECAICPYKVKKSTGN